MKPKRARYVVIGRETPMPYLEIEWTDSTIPKAMIYHEDVARAFGRAEWFEVKPWVVLGSKFNDITQDVVRSFVGTGEVRFSGATEDPAVIEIARKFLAMNGPGEIKINESED